MQKACRKRAESVKRAKMDSYGKSITSPSRQSTSRSGVGGVATADISDNSDNQSMPCHEWQSLFLFRELSSCH